MYIRLPTSLRSVVLNWLDKTNNVQVGNPVNVANQYPDQARQDQLPQSSQSPKLPVRIVQRRGSVAGGSLFSVNNETRETGWDYLRKVDFQHANGHMISQSDYSVSDTDTIEQDDDNEISESSAVIAHGHDIGESDKTSGNDIDQSPEEFAKQVLQISSNFNPFLRLPNPPFTLNGRRRANSVDVISRRPSLSTILEHDESINENADVDTKKPADSNEKIGKERSAVNAIVSKWVDRFDNYKL